MKLKQLGYKLKPLADYPRIEIRSYKWPKRARSIAWAWDIGSDEWGRWLGIGQGEPWRSADGQHSGVFERSFIKLVPPNSYWSACFNMTGNIIDIDLIAPVVWKDNILEEIDLELDILQSADGTIQVRDQAAFEQIKPALPAAMIQHVEQTCSYIQRQLEYGFEPFGSLGKTWLERWITIYA